MNLASQKVRNQKIIDFLTKPIGVNERGRTIFHTLWEAAVKFDLSMNHIHRIKRKWLIQTGKYTGDKDE